MNSEIPKHPFKILTKEEKKALYNLKNDHSFVIKRENVGSAAVVWAREYHIK